LNTRALCVPKISREDGFPRKPRVGLQISKSKIAVLLVFAGVKMMVD